jgi:GT2 family glycosyltransferase
LTTLTLIEWQHAQRDEQRSRRHSNRGPIGCPAPIGGPDVVSSARATVPVSVVIPTIGRPAMLERCLESIALAEPMPSELLVIDQSGTPAVGAVVSRCRMPGVRVLPCSGRGAARGVNLGLAEAASGIVLITNDDCTVLRDWVGIAWDLMERDSSRLISGRILPGGDPSRTPSVRMDEHPCTYTDELVYDALSGNNMVLNRDLVLALGGLDGRMGAAEDSDLCYRWLRSGGRIDYRPELTVVHHEWRTTVELERLYVRYWRGGGWFYGKHLRAGDLGVVPLLAGDVEAAARGAAAAVVTRKPRWTDPRRGFLRGFPPGLIEGWRASGRGRTAGGP